MSKYNEIKKELNEIKKEVNYDVINIKVVLPLFLYLDGDRDDHNISNKVFKKFDKNKIEWFKLPENTFEELRHKLHILLGTVYINEHMNGWGEVYFDEQISDWVKSKVNEIFEDFVEDEELFNRLAESDYLEDFTGLCPVSKYVFKLTDEQLQLDEDDRPMSFRDIINTCIEEESDYTYSKILGLIYGWSFVDSEICEQFEDDDWDVTICKYNS